MTATTEKPRSQAQAVDAVASLLELAETANVEVTLLADRVKISHPGGDPRWLSVLEANSEAIFRHLSGTPQLTGSFNALSAGEFIQQNPELRPAVIEGLFRRGETTNVIGAAKAGKSFLIAGMLLSVASGRQWLGHDVTQGRCLLIDNELHPELLADRLKRVAAAMDVDFDSLPLDIWPLRGRLLDINDIRGELLEVKPGTYSMVALDAFYRVLPKGVSENDNAMMAGVYNHLDAIASDLDAAVVLNHHSSKGDQSSKSITDVGSGAGSISRAADTHLILRPHELGNAAVLEAVTRSWAPPTPRTIVWHYPLWQESSISPEVARPRNGQEIKREKMNREADDKLRELLSKRPMTRSQLRTETGYGASRVNGSAARLIEVGLVRERKLRRKSTGKRVERLELI